MKLKLLLVLVSIIFFLSCQSGLDINSTKHTASDPIADITYMNGYFYSTNLDLSGNAGSQIDLYKFDSNALPVNRYPLDLNGQGYLATTSDGVNLYFQPRFTDYIFKSTPLGEIFWHKSDIFPDNMADTTTTFMDWRGRGITWADSNLVALYRHKDDSTLYRWRFLTETGDGFNTVKDNIVVWNHLNDNGVFALDYDPVENTFLILATDSTENLIIYQVTDSLKYKEKYYTIDEEVMGLTIVDSTLYLSYPDRRIEKFTRVDQD